MYAISIILSWQFRVQALKTIIQIIQIRLRSTEIPQMCINVEQNKFLQKVHR